MRRVSRTTGRQPLHTSRLAEHVESPSSSAASARVTSRRRSAGVEACGAARGAAAELGWLNPPASVCRTLPAPPTERGELVYPSAAFVSFPLRRGW